jgi:hypothetical protein
MSRTVVIYEAPETGFVDGLSDIDGSLAWPGLKLFET